MHELNALMYSAHLLFNYIVSFPQSYCTNHGVVHVNMLLSDTEQDVRYVHVTLRRYTESV